MTPFPDFFRAATGHEPYPYQRRLAEADPLPQLLNIPTGAGKTAAVILAWLWRRRFAAEAIRHATPRRLVYCLPMRVLVEQTVGEAQKWVGNLREKCPEVMADPLSVHILMGGDVDDDWPLHPERDAILVGTQDMLLSRALNHGYAESRFHWPISFGSVNNDSLWVLDEVQLMGPGLATTAQLAAFRASFGVMGPCPTIWMSATLNREWLMTVDFRDSASTLSSVGLETADREDSRLERRMKATKVVRRATSVPGWKDKHYADAVARLVLECHRAGSLTLVVVNTVDRARQIFRALLGAGDKLKPGGRGRKSGVAATSPDVVPLHSRFRPPERRALTSRMLSPLPPDGRIVVATQVLEAGVDISSRLLVTELAPWASLVQRFGRCNRTGEEADAEIIWLEPARGGESVESTLAVPYEVEDLATARKTLRSLEGCSLAPAKLPEVAGAAAILHVLRRKDLLELFDTAPDISGSDVDISRFIRDADEREVYVCWREWERAERGTPPPRDMPGPNREELCPAPIGEFREFLKANRPAFTWDHLEGSWARVRQDALRPGMMVLLPVTAGGYSWESATGIGLGWDYRSNTPVDPLVEKQPTSRSPDSTRHDPASSGRTWISLADHTDAVVRTAELILQSLNLDPSIKEVILRAARWHDAGKSHEVFQQTLKRSCPEAPPPREGEVWAKSPGRAAHHSRPHFRHELASALALLSNPGALGDIPEHLRDLVIYLVASHHGKVRLAARSLLGEQSPKGGRRSILGIWDDDPLPAVFLGGGTTLPATLIKLTPLEIGLGDGGQPSWMERMLRLRDRAHLGPFRLAYMEALVRAADGRASAGATVEGTSNA